MPESMTHPTQAHEAVQKPPEIDNSAQNALGFEQAAPTPADLRRSMQRPDHLHPKDVLAIQRGLGNRTANQVLRRGPKIQAKLTVGAANDPAEAEADQVADEVLRMPAPLVRREIGEEEEESLQGNRIRRANTEEEEPLQGKRLRRAETEEEEPLQGKRLQRADKEEEEPLQAKSEAVDPLGSFEAGAEVEQSLAAQRGGGSPLPEDLRSDLEPRFGADFSGVRVHTGAQSEQINRDLSAQAFTHGQDIYMGAGKYDPQSGAGRQLLAHELTHVIQQGGAAVQLKKKPTPAARIQARLQRKLEPANAKNVTGTDIFETELKLGKIVIKMTTPPAPSTSSEAPPPPPAPTPVILVHVPDNTSKIVIDRDKKAGDPQYVWAEYGGKKGYLKESEVSVIVDAGFDAKYNVMTVMGLNQYVAEHANWNDDLASNDQRARIKKFVEFAQSPDPKVLGPCGSFPLNDILTEAASSDLDTIFEALKIYSKAVTASVPFRVDLAPNAKAAVKRGAALKKLIAAFPDYVLNTAINNDLFLALIGKNGKNTDYTDDVIAYYNTSQPKPLFEAINGSDFESYLNFRIVDNGNPLDYYTDAQLQGRIRNFHRFTKATLDKLKQNFVPPTTKTLPLTLILHTALDHNGAFHRDPFLQAVISDTHILAIMIEGKETLADVGAEIDTLATTYGMNNKIDQVMFAGHGSSQSIELAGKVKKGTDGKLQEDSKALDVGTPETRVEARKLLDKILANMDEDLAAPDLQPHRRIVFNACLTNSNAVRKKIVAGDWTAAAAEINKYIHDNPSLTTYLKQIVEEKSSGHPAPVSAVGANASIGQVELIDPTTHELTIKSRSDSKVSSLNKLDYVKEGHEPGGALWALVETFGASYGDTTKMAALDAALVWRLAQPATQWDDAIIKTLYGVIKSRLLSLRPDALRIFGYAAESISEMKHKEHCKVAEIGLFAKILSFLWPDLLAALALTTEWKKNNFIPLVFYQAAMIQAPGEAAWQVAFIDHLAAKFNCQTAAEFIDFTKLAGAGLIAALLGGSASSGKLILALMAILNDNAQVNAKAYLVKSRHPGGPEAPELPAQPEIPVLAPAIRTSAVAAVPPAPGRAPFPRVPAVTASTEKRSAIPKVNPLLGLPALAISKGSFFGWGKKSPDAGRPKRDARALIPAVPAVGPFFPSSLEIDKKLAGRSTEDEIIRLLPAVTPADLNGTLEPEAQATAATNYRIIPGS